MTCRRATFATDRQARLAARAMEPNRSKQLVSEHCETCGLYHLAAPAVGTPHSAMPAGRAA